MENKELMETIEKCSEILLLNDYKGFYEYVNNSKFKTELIAEFKDEYEEAKEEYGLKEDKEIDYSDKEDVINYESRQRLLDEEKLRQQSQKEIDEELEKIFPNNDRPSLGDLRDLIETASNIKDEGYEYNIAELEKFLNSFKQLVNNLKNHKDFDFLEDDYKELLSEFGFENENEVELVFTDELSILKGRENAAKAEACLKAKDFEGFIENYDSDEDNYSENFLSKVGNVNDLYVEIKELVEAYKQGLITKEQMQKFKYKKYGSAKCPKASNYIKKILKLEEEAKKPMELN